MSKCIKYGHDLPTECRMLCGHEDCSKHKLYKPTRFDTMSKCESCRHKSKCNQIDANRIVLNGETQACLSYDKQPTRFDTFRLQTATIDGLVDYAMDNMSCNCCSKCDSCPFTGHYEESKEEEIKVCKQGIKAYWEVEVICIGIE